MSIQNQESNDSPQKRKLDALFDRIPKEPRYGYPFIKLPVERLAALADDDGIYSDESIGERMDEVISGSFPELGAGDKIRIHGAGIFFPEGSSQTILELDRPIYGVLDTLTVLPSPEYGEWVDNGRVVRRVPRTPGFILKECMYKNPDNGMMVYFPMRLILPLNSDSLIVEKVVVPEGLS